MSRIFCIVGKSCSGKDTLYARILAQNRPGLVPVVPCTTRPRRPGEVEGQSYHFVTQEQLRQYENTTQGLWTYFTLRFDLDTDRLLITTLAGARALMDCYGPGHVRVVYLHVDDRTRLLRYIDRESRQARPDYAEVCRRFLADQTDFSEEQLAQFPRLHRIDTGAEMEECLARWDALYRLE